MEKSLGSPSPGSGHHVEPEAAIEKVDEPCTKEMHQQPGSKESGSSGSLVLLEEAKKVDLQLPAQVTHQQPDSIGKKEKNQESKSSGSLVVPEEATETVPADFKFGVTFRVWAVNFSHQEAVGNQPAVEVQASANTNPFGVPQVPVEASSNTTRREWKSTATNSPMPQIDLKKVITETGEEDENNVYEIGGKLFVYVTAKIVEAEQTEDKQNEEEEVEKKLDAGKGEDAKKKKLPAHWKLMGCGLLKLKEKKKKPLKPRLLLRERCGNHPSLGKLRIGDVVLNSNIWSTMSLKKVKREDGSVVPDQIQFSATLNGKPDVFLFQRTCEGDSDAMFDQIESRIHKMKRQEIDGEEESDSDDEEETDEEESDDAVSGEAESDEAPSSSPKRQKLD